MRRNHQPGRSAIISALYALYLAACTTSGAGTDPGAGADADLAGGDAAPAAADADTVIPELTQLSLSSTSPMVPDFDPSHDTYEVKVSVLESELTVTTTALDSSVTILVNGTAVGSGGVSSPIVLDLGTNQLHVEVVSSSGNSSTYVIDITRGVDVIEQVAYGKASNTGLIDQFGTSVALSGDTLAVGAFMERSNAIGVDGDQLDNQVNSGGAVYLYQ